MGQQQLLLIILGVIIVGIAIAVGLQLFQSGSIGANHDAIINDIMNISAHADQWRIRPEAMGGGGGEFDDYVLPARLETTGNGTFEITARSGSSITIVGTSSIHTGAVRLVYDADETDDSDKYTWTHMGEFGDADMPT